MNALNDAWKKCNRCKATIYNLDFQMHKEYCSELGHMKKKCFPHGYVLKGIFHVIAGSLDSIPGHPKLVLPSFQRSLLLMHPKTMKFLNFVKGDLVNAEGEDGHFIFSCWPCELVLPSTVIIPSLLTICRSMGVHLKISHFIGSLQEAEKIVLSPNDYKPFMKSKYFQMYMENEMRQFYLSEGMKLHVTYLAYSFSVKVRKVSSSENSVKIDGKNLSDTNYHNLCSYFSSLNLEDYTKSENLCDKVSNFDFDHSKFKSSTPISSPASGKLLSSTEKSLKCNRNNDAKMKCKTFYCACPNTVVFIENEKCDDDNLSKKVTFKNFGGLKEQICEIKAFIDSSLQIAMKTHGILLVGPPGTGKSMMCDVILSEYQLPSFGINCQFIESTLECYEAKLKDVFDNAAKITPSVIFIDNLDFVEQFPHAKNIISEFSTVLSELMNSVKGVILIGTTNEKNAVSFSLRKNGIFEKEILFNIPSASERKEIFLKILKSYKHSLNEKHISELSDCTHGYTGGDIKRLCDKAKLSACLKSNNKNFHKAAITFEDFMEKIKDIKPAAVVELTFEVPNVKWSDIGGMRSVKTAITEMVDWPLKHTAQFKKFKITPPRGILMYGPPGCSKTMIAKALVSESHFNFISVKGPQLFNKYVGESEKGVSEIFRKARTSTPCVIFFDEIDSIAPIRGSTTGNSNVAERVLTQLLVEIDGIDVLQGVSIVAATNRPDRIDPSLLRPGRFDHLIYVPLPDVATRKDIFEIKLRNMPLAADVNLMYLVDATDNYTGAEIAEVCREAVMEVIKENVTSPDSVVTMHHFLMALHLVKPRTTKEMTDFYENYKKKNLL